MACANPNDSSLTEESICVLCCDEYEFSGCGPCDHPICLKCCVKLRILRKEYDCPVCRTHLKQVIISKGYKLWADKVKKTGKKNYVRIHGIVHESRESQAEVDKLLEHRCPVCGQLFQRFHQLKDHLGKEHSLWYCDICVRHLKIFTHERKCYTREDLVRHRKEGDADDRSHRGHPACRFCDELFLDNDELLLHLRKNHFWCHICEKDGSQDYYRDYKDLREHFKHAHYLCEEGDCAREKFTNVFRMKVDYQAHIAQTHSDKLSKAEARKMRQLDVNITFSSRLNNDGLVSGQDFGCLHSSYERPHERSRMNSGATGYNYDYQDSSRSKFKKGREKDSQNRPKQRDVKRDETDQERTKIERHVRKNFGNSQGNLLDDNRLGPGDNLDNKLSKDEKNSGKMTKGKVGNSKKRGKFASSDVKENTHVDKPSSRNNRNNFMENSSEVHVDKLSSRNNRNNFMENSSEVHNHDNFKMNDVESTFSKDSFSSRACSNDEIRERSKEVHSSKVENFPQNVEDLPCSLTRENEKELPVYNTDFPSLSNSTSTSFLGSKDLPGLDGSQRLSNPPGLGDPRGSNGPSMRYKPPGLSPPGLGPFEVNGPSTGPRGSDIPSSLGMPPGMNMPPGFNGSPSFSVPRDYPTKFVKEIQTKLNSKGDLSSIVLDVNKSYVKGKKPIDDLSIKTKTSAKKSKTDRITNTVTPTYDSDFPSLSGLTNAPKSSVGAPVRPPPGMGWSVPLSIASNGCEKMSRTQVLVKEIRRILNLRNESFDQFKDFNQRYRQGKMNAEDYFEQCSKMLGEDNIRKIFGELISSLPDEEKKTKLLQVYNDAKVKAKSQNGLRGKIVDNFKSPPNDLMTSGSHAQAFNVQAVIQEDFPSLPKANGIKNKPIAYTSNVWSRKAAGS